MPVDVGYATLVLASVTAVLAIITAYHAWQSKHLVSEMRKDRRRQFLENALEKAYSPLFEILRVGMRSSHTSGFNFSSLDMDRIQGMIEAYGHYLDITLADEFRVKLVDNPSKLEWQHAELYPLYEEIMNKSRMLSKELQNLVSG